jgi:hypothetical protein
MGYSLTWLAARGRTPEEVRTALGLRLTDQREEFPESPFSAITMPGGWYVVVANEFDESFADEPVLARLSDGSSEIVTCFVEEHVMASEACEWKAGKKLWRVSHQSDQGIFHLAAGGQLPATFEKLLGEARSQQEKAGGQAVNVDHLFDVPVEIAKSRTGFRHDEGDHGHAEKKPFEILMPIEDRHRRAAPSMTFVDRIGMCMLAFFSTGIVVGLLFLLKSTTALAMGGGFEPPWSPAVVLPLLVVGTVTAATVTVGLLRRMWTGSTTVLLAPISLNTALSVCLAVNGLWLALRIGEVTGLTAMLGGVGLFFASVSFFMIRRRRMSPSRTWSASQ